VAEEEAWNFGIHRAATSPRKLKSALEVIREPEVAAARADLTYVSDFEPGIRRRRAGKGFCYLAMDGRRICDGGTLERIKALAIPPAWADVWICPDPSGHIQATGRDQRGRKQYRYHPAWLACRDHAKFSTLATFAETLPRLRIRVNRDLRKQETPRARVIASVVWLLDNTMIRIGNDSYARENKSFGLTTLRTRHIEVDGSELRFRFVGKSGNKWNLKLVDRRIAKIVREIQELPGQHLFQYRDGDGSFRVIRSQDVNDYIHAACGPEFSSKDFRTWGATVEATLKFAQTERPTSKREQSQAMNKVIDTVARRLRNTRAICRSCYIHPVVMDAWQAGRLGDEISALRRRYRKALSGLDIQESIVLRWLLQATVQRRPGSAVG
jgi:DNA topoisomerase-1